MENMTTEERRELAIKLILEMPEEDARKLLHELGI